MNARGITLIELMIVITILGVLGTIATAAYRGHAERAHRVDAMTALQRIKDNQERIRTATNTYSADFDALGFPGAVTPDGNYALDFPTAPDTRTFVVRASVITGGGQDTDTECRWFTLSATGVEDSGAETDCW